MRKKFFRGLAHLETLRIFTGYTLTGRSLAPLVTTLSSVFPMFRARVLLLGYNVR